MSAIGHRICVVGTSGSGKTTTAAQIAHALQIKHIELDALHWGPNWSETPINEFRQLVTKSLSGSFWVVDGNYGKVRDIVWLARRYGRMARLFSPIDHVAANSKNNSPSHSTRRTLGRKPREPYTSIPQ